MHFSAVLPWSKGAAEFSSSYVMVCWCLCLENLFFSWRVSGAVSYLSWVTAERAAGRGRCARVWSSRKKQLLSPSSPCVQHFRGSPCSSQEHGASPSGQPRAANEGKRKSGLGALPGAVCTVCTPAPESHSADGAELSAGRDAVGQGDESRARWRDAVG